MDKTNELTEEEYKKNIKLRSKEKKLKRNAFGSVNEVGKYFGPWAGYEDIEKSKFTKIDFSRFNKIVNKNCCDTNNEKVINFENLKIEKNLKLKQHNFSYPNQNSKLLKSHKLPITGIKYLEHYDILISSGLDAKINLYKMSKDGGCIRTIYGHSRGVSYFDTKDVLLFSGSYDGYFKTYNLLSGKTYGRYNVKNLITSGCKDFDKNVIHLGGSNRSINSVDLRCKNIVNSDTLNFGDTNKDNCSVTTIKNVYQYENCINKTEIIDENIIGCSLFSKDLLIYDKRNHNILFHRPNVSLFTTLNEKILFLENKKLYILYNNEIEDLDIRINNISSDLFISDDKSILYFSDQERNIFFVSILNEEGSVMTSSKSTILCKHKYDVSYLYWKTLGESCLYIGDVRGNIQERIFKE